MNSRLTLSLSMLPISSIVIPVVVYQHAMFLRPVSFDFLPVTSLQVGRLTSSAADQSWELHCLNEDKSGSFVSIIKEGSLLTIRISLMTCPR